VRSRTVETSNRVVQKRRPSDMPVGLMVTTNGDYSGCLRPAVGTLAATSPLGFVEGPPKGSFEENCTLPYEGSGNQG